VGLLGATVTVTTLPAAVPALAHINTRPWPALYRRGGRCAR